MNRRGLLSVAVGAACLPGYQGWAQPVAAPKPEASPLVLENTAVHNLTARESGRSYPIWVDLPRSYGEAESAERRFPVVVASDAPWSHAYLRTIRHFVGRRGQNIEDFILIGLAPEQGLSHLEYRCRDYTPTDPRRRPAGQGGHDYGSMRYGEAALYQTFLAEQVLPFVAQQYRCNAQRRVFIGHSYGALLGLNVLFSQPELFGHYILGSPSLWFDQRVMFDMEKAAAAQRKNLPAQVRMYAGGYETFGKTPRHYKATDLVGDMRAFERQLRSRRYSSLSMASQVIADEDHFTVFPSLATRGLTWALPGHGPYLSG